MSELFEDRPWSPLLKQLGVQLVPPTDAPVSEFVRHHAEVRPDRPAVVLGGFSLSYGLLYQESCKLAHALQGLGISKGDVVGVHMPSLPQYAAISVAAGKLGAVVASVSPLYTPAEAAAQIEDAGISILFSLDVLAAGCLGKLTEKPGKLETLIITTGAEYWAPGQDNKVSVPGVHSVTYAEITSGKPDSFEQSPVTGEDICLYQYTGGTTGRPKGAILTHRICLDNGEQAWAHRPFEIGRENIASAAPFFHIAGIASLLYAMRTGSTICCLPDPRDIKQFCQYMLDYPPTFTNATPALYQLLLQDPMSREIDFSGLKIAITGAAPLMSSVRAQIEALIGPGKLMEVFGMTETGPVYIANPPDLNRPAAIGIPLPGCDVRIVDVEEPEKELPYGEPGEIIVHGPHNMLGYRNMKEETDNALRVREGRTYMHSGDVGYMDEEGFVYLCDRAKDMLIVGGFKVFSVEVEEKVETLDEIMRAAVVATPNLERPGNDIVNLYVELSPAGRDRAGEDLVDVVRAYCKENLAPYKVPKVIRIVEQVPLTPVGKVDKKRLRSAAVAEAGGQA